MDSVAGKGLYTFLYKEYENIGVSISGGEAQEIAIAQAIYINASLMILYEPTAVLDSKFEYDVYTRLANLIGSKDVIYITHRLTSCTFYDEIFVMDDGYVAGNTPRCQDTICVTIENLDTSEPKPYNKHLSSREGWRFFRLYV